ncbi:TetR/AcrR family transcriptional regulator [Brevibacillus humidisoli]|uniref:TetR/AcrR family transcriptional regulator n=1 Tax=Brevibacillus humidisoli TaxID=2895522 RepID=UPI001E41DA8E|nr:TetR/AcrR family transcriptional regulator [Brevibacillus humidisoli]UFJ40862.1 TetR/AcrR family transcriptional regulator [Brevibacillus humidisoli]
MAKPNTVSKQELIKSAQECIVRDGLQKLTLQAVAKGANVTQGTVYYHFRSKEQLLLDIVEDVCRTSWQSLARTEENGEDLVVRGLESARSRCTEDSFYHQLFLSLVVAGFANPNIRRRLGKLLDEENGWLTDRLSQQWQESPVEGVSLATWSVLMNALVDGLALQALLREDFSADQVYAELEVLLRFIMQSGEKREG